METHQASLACCFESLLGPGEETQPLGLEEVWKYRVLEPSDFRVWFVLKELGLVSLS